MNVVKFKMKNEPMTTNYLAELKESGKVIDFYPNESGKTVFIEIDADLFPDLNADSLRIKRFLGLV